jgi:hypothetical protein
LCSLLLGLLTGSSCRRADSGIRNHPRLTIRKRLPGNGTLYAPQCGMGGIASGANMRWDTRDTIDDVRALHIGKLASEGWLRSGSNCSYWQSRDGQQTDNILVTAKVGQIVLSYRTRSSGKRNGNVCLF